MTRLLGQAVADGGCDPRQDEVTGLVTLVNRLGVDPVAGLLCGVPGDAGSQHRIP